MSEINRFAQCVPINSLPAQHIQSLFAETEIQQFNKDEELFCEGDGDEDSVYLLQGTVELASQQNSSRRLVEAGTESARYALAQLKPRQHTGSAATDVVVARVNSMKIDQYLTMDQMTNEVVTDNGSVEVSEMTFEVDTEWMFDLMRMDTFQQLPAERFTELINHFEPCETAQGEVVVRQGEPGDFYYLVREGGFSVTRQTRDGKTGKLAELGPGDVFGEEALISNAPRNASVTSDGQGMLMRLSKTSFDELLKPSLIKSVSHAETEKLLKNGAGLLDVRTEDEFGQGALRIAQNVPLYRLRRVLDQLDRERPYILCCQTGLRSNTAAFLMNQRGFDVYVLAGGLQSLRKQAGSQ